MSSASKERKREEWNSRSSWPGKMHSVNKPQSLRKAGLSPTVNNIHSEHGTLSVFAIILNSRVSTIIVFAGASLQTPFPVSANFFVIVVFLCFHGLFSLTLRDPASEFLLCVFSLRSPLKAFHCSSHLVFSLAHLLYLWASPTVLYFF